MSEQPFRELPVIDAKRFGVVSCTAVDTLASVARTMVERDISSVVVIDTESALQGIITRTDLVRAALRQEMWATQLVADYMSTGVVTVTTSDRLEAVMQLLIERQIHRVVVVQRESGRLQPIAVLSAADILYHMVQR